MRYHFLAALQDLVQEMWQWSETVWFSKMILRQSDAQHIRFEMLVLQPGSASTIWQKKQHSYLKKISIFRTNCWNHQKTDLSLICPFLDGHFFRSMMRNSRDLCGTQVATVQNSTSAVEPLQPPPWPLELEHRAATLSMKLGAVVFFLKLWGIYKGRMLGLYDYILVMSALNSLLKTYFVLIVFSYHECVWTVASGRKENRHLGSAISNQY